MAKRGRKRTGPGVKTYAIIVLVALVIPLSVNLLLSGGPIFSELGEKVATFAAMLGMPDAGLELIRERFQAQLYRPQEAVPQTPVLPIPQTPPDQEGASEEPQSSEGDRQSEQEAAIQPRIPARYRAELISESFSGQEEGDNLRVGAGLLRNDTKYATEEIARWLEDSISLVFEDTDQPQVLIYHTHATESFERYDSQYYDTRNTWRSNDNNNNMVAVGAAMAHALEEAGVAVLHDTTQHDYPSYNGSYERSAETISAYLEEYPSIKVILDLHRDAMERENQAIVKPVAEIDGKKAAQIMIIAGADNGSMGMEGWRENMLFAAALQDAMESRSPGLTRPILLSHRKYNQDLSGGALLLEFGSNANTLEEAVYSAQLAGQALADLISQNTTEDVSDYEG